MLEKIKQRVMEVFDREVVKLSQGDYKELLEDLIGSFEALLECVKEEMAEDE